ncbi:hypothetical protein AB6A40_001766 [Gnathostoma spinigerum]|uniref:Uncharacterized protein n=1 Tax=Gnathostoma spinigerum TaxID=75299 RepID=A0ABD6E739_9BILA
MSSGNYDGFLDSNYINRISSQSDNLGILPFYASSEYPMSLSSGRTRRKLYSLQRHPRSFDGMELIGESDPSSNEWLNLPPLNISTSRVAEQPYNLGALSNPTTSNAAFWNQPNNCEDGRIGRYTSVPGAQLSQEFDLLKKEYENALLKLNSTMNSIKTFWSPELKRERQLRKEETAKLLALQTKIAQRGVDAIYDSDKRVMELECELERYNLELVKKDETIRNLMETGPAVMRDSAAATQVAELETRCEQLESLIAIRDQQLRASKEQLAQLSFIIRDPNKDRRIADLEAELSRLQTRDLDAPRDFTDKSVTSHELHTTRMKLERSEMELSKKSSELAASRMQLQTLMEENADLRRHVGSMKDTLTTKEQQAVLLQSDIEALRSKLESKNGQLEQKSIIIERLESEVTRAKSQITDLQETNKSSEQRTSQLVARLDGLETLLREKESELEKTKRKLNDLPDVQMERSLQLKLDEAIIEKNRLLSLIDDLRQNAEKERTEQLQTFQAQNVELTSTIECLQKELSDRQILLESQNEKIGDLGRELGNCEKKQPKKESDVSKDDKIQLAEARKEIDSLLRMLQNLEKEKTSLISQCKQLQSSLDEACKPGTTSATIHRSDAPKIPSSGTLKNRIEELEEALRESVSITAERELHIAQQRQLNQQLTQQLVESRREISELKKCVKELSKGDREEIMKAFEVERRKHIEELLFLKHEALLAAISEKDAHIALLSQSRDKPPAEIETLRHHREKLMEKLREENERRAQLTKTSPSACVTPGAPLQSSYLDPVHYAPILGSTSTAQLPSTSSVADQEDDAEGIWA